MISWPRGQAAGGRQSWALRCQPQTDNASHLWLDAAISKEHALSLLESYPAELMTAYPASTRVNSVRNDDSGLLVPDHALAA